MEKDNNNPKLTDTISFDIDIFGMVKLQPKVRFDEETEEKNFECLEKALNMISESCLQFAYVIRSQKDSLEQKLNDPSVDMSKQFQIRLEQKAGEDEFKFKSAEII